MVPNREMDPELPIAEAVAQFTAFTPTLIIGDFLPEVGRSFSLRGIVSDGPDLVGAGFAGALCALAGNCPTIAGLWIDYTLTSPGAPGTELRSDTFRRDILPPEFLEQWAAGGPAEWVTQPIIYEDRKPCRQPCCDLFKFWRRLENSMTPFWCTKGLLQRCKP